MKPIYHICYIDDLIQLIPTKLFHPVPPTFYICVIGILFYITKTSYPEIYFMYRYNEK